MKHSIDEPFLITVRLFVGRTIYTMSQSVQVPLFGSIRSFYGRSIFSEVPHLYQCTVPSLSSYLPLFTFTLLFHLNNKEKYVNEELCLLQSSLR